MIGVGLVFLAIWEFLPPLLDVPRYIIPTFSNCLEEFGRMMQRENLMGHFMSTLISALVGFALGGLLGARRVLRDLQSVRHVVRAGRRRGSGLGDRPQLRLERPDRLQLQQRISVLDFGDRLQLRLELPDAVAERREQREERQGATHDGHGAGVEPE